MKGMIKLDEFVIKETGIKVVILGDKATHGVELAMALLSTAKPVDIELQNS